MNRSLGLLLAPVALIVWTASARAASLDPEDAASHVGDNATVCGVVASAKYAARSGGGGPTFLNLGKPFPDQVFTAVIFEGDRAKFGTPEVSLRGRHVCVTGVIELYQGKPEIKLSDPRQLAE